MTNLKLYKVVLLLVFITTSLAKASEVTQVKENKVLIQIDTDDVQQNQEYFLVNGAGKKIGLVQITQVKNSKAIGTIIKGKANPGLKLQAKSANSNGGPQKRAAKDNSQEPRDSAPTASTKVKNSWGFLVGYSMQTMSASFRGGTPIQDYSLNMTGSNLSYFGFFNYAYTPNLIIEASGGLFPLNVATTITDPACIGTTTNCTVNINYLDGALLAKYYFPIKLKHKFWVGGGMDFLMPSSKTTTVLSEADIGFNQMFRFGFGTDLFVIGKKSFIPIQFDYTMFPPSAGVSSSTINLRFGYGSLF